MDYRCLVVVGAQWGDEGKGKITDVLAEQASIVARYQGGANAGHTVHTGGRGVHPPPDPVRRPVSDRALPAGERRRRRSVDAGRRDRDARGARDRHSRAARHLVAGPPRAAVSPAARRRPRGEPARQRDRHDRRGIGPAYRDKVARSGVRVVRPRRPAGRAAHRRGALRGANVRLDGLRGRTNGPTPDEIMDRLEQVATGPARAGHGHGRRDPLRPRRRRAGAARRRPGLAARRRPRHLPLRHVVQHDGRRRGRGGRYRSDADRRGARRREGLHDPGRQRPAAHRARGTRPPSTCASWAASSGRRRAAPGAGLVRRRGRPPRGARSTG